MENINMLSVAIAMIIPLVIGRFWYGENLFRNIGMKVQGIKKEKTNPSELLLSVGLSLISSFLLSIFLLNFNNQPGQEGQFDTFGHGAFHSIFLMLTFVFPILLTKKIYDQSSWKNLGVDIGFWAISIALMGGVLDMMNHWPNNI